ncbi:hypothetical protein GCM10010387_16110 [Streptomyces inusitatus]|uniref:RapZ C-terminal domain-containing protein n=1 Tax=Streptomyces inusitatus TaxID=68221 RepID=A0A918PX47_9ACTN|nr:RNase adapter RapZ [Streptomyces inusitatus]GGZ23687.1 hypothetical protein GCM10010387_16110 [Streptomyces inusitatus]
MTTHIRVISFGYGHSGTLDDDGRTVIEPPTADITLDLRRALHNPHHDPKMRHLTGLDDAVYERVLATPGAQLLAHNAALAAHMLMDQAQPQAVTIATGCAGGRHRAVAVARVVHTLLVDFARVGGYETDVVHRDVHRQVLPSSKHR